MTGHDFIDDLFSKSNISDKNEWDDKLFEQYKIYLKNINSLENSRKTSQNFFLSINTGLITVFGIFFQFIATLEFINQLWIVGICISGITFSCFWIQTIRSYTLLCNVKWNIILKIEKKLPLLLHETEWKILLNKNGISKYVKLTYVELIIPSIFIILYIVMIIFMFHLISQ